jgi:hypothetical protein
MAIERVTGIDGPAFAVVPTELAGAANEAQRVANAWLTLSTHVFAVLADVAAHGGLEIATAVREASSRWDCAIEDRALAIQNVADRLRTTAASYAAGDDRVAQSIARGSYDTHTYQPPPSTPSLQSPRSP